MLFDVLGVLMNEQFGNVGLVVVSRIGTKYVTVGFQFCHPLLYAVLAAIDVTPRLLHFIHRRTHFEIVEFLGILLLPLAFLSTSWAAEL